MNIVTIDVDSSELSKLNKYHIISENSTIRTYLYSSEDVIEVKLAKAVLLFEAVLVHFEPYVASQLKLLAEIEDFIDK